jgi:hypothetical protein
LLQHFNKWTVTCHYDLHAFAEQFLQSKQNYVAVSRNLNHFQDSVKLKTHIDLHTTVCLY